MAPAEHAASMSGPVPGYASFVVRVWHHDPVPRIDVEHIQTGDRTKADSVAAALAWIERVASANAAPLEEG
jgi:hypothetical protein